MEAASFPDSERTHMTRSFVHLHCHTHYSLLDGANRIPELVEHTKKQGMNALAITDHGNLYGAIEFYRECKAAGLNPIVGYEAYVSPGKRTERDARRRGDAAYHLTLLAQNATGFKNLIKISSLAFIEGYHYVPRIDKDLLEAHKDGLICLSGCASSEFSEFILKDQRDEALKVAEWFAKMFGKNFYVEIQNNGLEIQRQCAEGAIDIAERGGWPLVATCDAHYQCQGDAFAHEVLLAINTNKKLSDDKRMSYGSDQFYVQGPEEMYRRFPGRAEAVARSQEIADGVDIQLDFKKRHFPVFSTPAGKTPEQHLREIAERGLRERYGDPPPQAAVERLNHELDIICRMGFAGYFLITWDFVRFAREEGIPCTARGSGCGAITSYALYLSHVCPLEYDLLFERFMDPNRNEAPDIDIDFCQDRRERVIEYVKQKYGASSVAQIATFGTMAAKAALKDVGRVLDVPLDRVNQITKMVPARLGATLDNAMTEVPEFRKEYESDADTRRWFDVAMKLEGTNRQAGIHAAGVVIANGPIIDYVPVHRALRKGDDGQKSGEPIITTQWVMGDLEKVGMLKMDFLGLRTLTVLDNTVRLIKATRGKTVDLTTLPLDDAETFQLLCKGDAKGVFQLESEGIRELLKRLKPDNIRDIIALMALYRPGPLGGGMVDDYVNRKHGRQTWQDPHPEISEILKETYGVMVYQEQIMRILNRLGGIDLSSAYACIKAISKKKQEIIDQRQADFIRGAQERGISKSQAEHIFGLIVFFGGYGFNKSHSAAYAMIGYQTAYLKRHYTAEFMAALLSSEIDDGNKRDVMVEHIADARHLGVDVLPPDVNTGDAGFTVHAGKIVFGLTAIKGLGRSAAEEIVRARAEKGPFRDLYDFCERVDHRAVMQAAVEKLIKAGAFDAFGKRSALMQVLPRAMQASKEQAEDRKRGQRNFFDAMADDGDGGNGIATAEPLPDIAEWPETERLKYEKEALDFYLSSHPLAQFDADLKRFTSYAVEQTRKLNSDSEVCIGGMISQVRYFTSKKSNKRYARCKIEDFTGVAECVMWPSDYERFAEMFVDDKIVLAQGRLERSEYAEEPILVLTKLLTVEQAKRELTTALLLRMNLTDHRPEQVDTLGKILKRTPGPCRVQLQVTDGGGRRALLKLGDEYRVDVTRLAVEELEMILGRGGVVFTGRG
jgi:DNA polymerase-3 subunit alpha